MKTINLAGYAFNVIKSSNAAISIYEFDQISEKPVVIAEGSNLKDACLNWIKSGADISGIVENMELNALELGLDLVLDIATAGIEFDKFVDSLTGEELFAMMAHGTLHDFVDWEH